MAIDVYDTDIRCPECEPKSHYLQYFEHDGRLPFDDIDDEGNDRPECYYKCESCEKLYNGKTLEPVF